jgi:hypothetical protein
MEPVMSDNPENGQAPEAPLSEAQAGPTRVTWDDSKMTTSFANVVNVLATREEMTLLFGTNQTWNAAASNELVVTLSDRIVLTPYAAKRLSVLLDRRVQEYEQRFGKLEI